MKLQCKDRQLDLSRPCVMGVLNVTPDSFSDGGDYLVADAAIARASEMQAQGAAIIDIGGESTRPGAEPVSEPEELRRVLPVIEALSSRLDCLISIDTSKPAVMRAACAAGAGLINDVRALREPGALAAANESGAAVCLMHMQGAPRSMQDNPGYDHVVQDVRAFLASRVSACTQAGIGDERLVIDPGFGFGKQLEHNLQLLRDLPVLAALGLPLLIGVSRKSMFRELVGAQTPQARVPASLAAAAIAAWQGASIVRTHDVGATCDALAVASAIKGSHE